VGVGLWVGLAVSGYTPGQCVPVEPQQPECVAPADCLDLAHPDCVGGWTCTEGACDWRCGTVCHDDADCGPLETCELTVHDACCAPGEMCLMIYPPCDGVCVPAGSTATDLVPACVHVPNLVGAGGTLPIAVYGQTTGCTSYDHADVTVSGYDIHVQLVGSTIRSGVCPACLWTYIGLVQAPVPTPGAYRVTVEGAGTWTAVASGGIIESPACQDDCPSPPVSAYDWTLAHLSSQEVATGCGDYVNVDVPVTFQTTGGPCQDFTVSGAGWPFAATAEQCTDSLVLFGAEPPYWESASVCPGPGGSPARVMLGVAVGRGAGVLDRVFLLEGQGR
jgi:hypothetical protein